MAEKSRTPKRDYSLGEVEVSMSPQERFEEYVQTRGGRNTEPRRILIDHIFSYHDHFDPDQLIARLPNKGDDGYVSRPTIYRTLSELVDAGLLRKFEVDGRAVFEHDYGHPLHDHLYCQKCQQLFEFQSEELIAMRDQVASDHNFRVTGHRLIIHGICENCAKARRQTQRRVGRSGV